MSSRRSRAPIFLARKAAVVDAHGYRNWDRDIEDKANFLAGALLITPEAAFVVTKMHIDLIEAAGDYGISTIHNAVSDQ